MKNKFDIGDTVIIKEGSTINSYNMKGFITRQLETFLLGTTYTIYTLNSTENKFYNGNSFMITRLILTEKLKTESNNKNV